VTGSYRLAFVAAGLAVAGSAVAAWIAAPPARSPQISPPDAPPGHLDSARRETPEASEALSSGSTEEGR
jgi:hypothetical protein